MINYLILFSIVITFILMVKIERTQSKINALQADIIDKRDENDRKRDANIDRLSENLNLLAERVAQIEEEGHTTSSRTVIVRLGDEEFEREWEEAKTRGDEMRERHRQARERFDRKFRRAKA